MFKITHIQLIMALICLSSCNLTRALYGIKNVAFIDKIDLIKHDFILNAKESYVLNKNFIGFLDTLKSGGLVVEQNYHFQPLKVYYYHYDTLISIHVNCYTGGFPNLNWNRYGAFDVFPARSQFKPDTLIPLAKHLQYLEDSMGFAPKPLSSKYTVLIYWNVYMGRQSRQFLNTLSKNLEQTPLNTRVIYVNNDQFFYGNIN